MSPLPVIADVFRVTFNWKENASGAVVAHNVMHFFDPGDTEAGLAATLDGAWQANQTGWLPNTYGLESYDILALDGVSSTVHIASTAGIVGQSSGDAIPAAAALVKLRTGLRGRQKRGRIFLPYVNEARQAAGILTSTTVTQGQTAWTAWLGAMFAAGAQLVVASYVGGSATTVTDLVYESVLGTMRRRQQALR